MVKIQTRLFTLFMNERRFRFAIAGKKSLFQILLEKYPSYVCLGMPARTLDGKYVVFLDYDYFHLRDLLDDFVYLAKRYLLSSCPLFESKIYSKHIGNFFVPILDKFDFDVMLDIMKKSRCDRGYIEQFLKKPDRLPVMRISAKVKGYEEHNVMKYVGMLETKFREHECSLQHYLTLRKYFSEIPELTLKFDKFDEPMELVEYATAGR